MTCGHSRADWPRWNNHGRLNPSFSQLVPCHRNPDALQFTCCEKAPTANSFPAPGKSIAAERTRSVRQAIRRTRRQPFTVACGRKERFSDRVACFPRARLVHNFSQTALMTSKSVNNRTAGCCFFATQQQIPHTPNRHIFLLIFGNISSSQSYG